MEYITTLQLIAIIGVSILFFYTIHLIRIKKLSADLAVSWIVTEFSIGILLCFKDILFHFEKIVGKEYTSLFLLFLIVGWIILLMLDTLTRVSSLTEKIRSVVEENALLKERILRLEESIKK